jgi:hypothetical protein
MSELEISKAQLVQHSNFACDCRLVLEECHALFNRHVEHFGDVLAVILHFERVLVVTRAFARGAGDFDVWQERELRCDGAFALAFFAATTFDIEAERGGCKTTLYGIQCLGKQFANRVVKADIRRRVRSRRSADR